MIKQSFYHLLGLYLTIMFLIFKYLHMSKFIWTNFFHHCKLIKTKTEPEETSSNCLLTNCPKPKDTQFAIICNRTSSKSFEMLEPENVWHSVADSFSVDQLIYSSFQLLYQLCESSDNTLVKVRHDITLSHLKQQIFKLWLKGSHTRLLRWSSN